MNRRAAIRFAALSLFAPAAALAQVARRYRVGCLYVADDALVKPFQDAFVAAMRDRGYLPGRNLDVDVRYAGGDMNRLPVLADELIALKPDVLLGIESVAVVLRTRTGTIPIVVSSSTDPVAAGLAKSLARPGGNVTGIAALGAQIVVKQVDLLADIVPGISRIGLLNDPLAPSAPSFEQFARTAATAKGLTLSVAEAKDADGLRDSFATLERARAQAVVVAGTGRMNQLRQEVISEARRLRLPSISSLPAAAWADAGGLITYATDGLGNFRYAASYVDRILKGAKPADLPIEQSARFEFVINLKTAREIGITIPRSILLRADRVIE